MDGRGDEAACLVLSWLSSWGLCTNSQESVIQFHPRHFPLLLPFLPPPIAHSFFFFCLFSSFPSFHPLSSHSFLSILFYFFISFYTSSFFTLLLNLPASLLLLMLLPLLFFGFTLPFILFLLIPFFLSYSNSSLPSIHLPSLPSN